MKCSPGWWWWWCWPMTFGIHRITIFLDQRLNRDWARVVVSWFKLINNFIYASRCMGCRWAAVFERLKAEGKQNYNRNKKGRKEGRKKKLVLMNNLLLRRVESLIGWLLLRKKEMKSRSTASCCTSCVMWWVKIFLILHLFSIKAMRERSLR